MGDGVYNCGMEKDTICLQVGVKVFIDNGQGKYLLLKRADGKYADIVRDRWDIVGGRIDPGTPLLENLRREVKEETALKLVGVPRLVAAQDILRKPGFHVVRLTYVGEVEGEVSLDPEEHDAYRWLSKEELLVLGENLDGYVRELLSANVV